MVKEVKCDIYETGYYGRNCFLAAAATEYSNRDIIVYLNSIDPNLVTAKDRFGNDDLQTAIIVNDCEVSDDVDGTFEFLIECLSWT